MTMVLVFVKKCRVGGTIGMSIFNKDKYSFAKILSGKVQ